jgi:hypothetical protein
MGLKLEADTGKKTLNHGWILISKQVLLQKFYTGAGCQIVASN